VGDKRAKSLDVQSQEAQAKEEYLVALGRLKRPHLAIEAVNRQRPVPLRISPLHIRRWGEDDDHFRNMCEYWAEFLKARLEDTAYDMALNEEKPDGAMVRFLLQHEYPEKYGKKVTVQSGPRSTNTYLPPIIDVEVKPVKDE
jgi:hypothetical protein